VGPRVGLDLYEISRPNRDSIHGLSSPQPVAIPTELPGPICGGNSNLIEGFTVLHRVVVLEMSIN
jgi:hypothetical protein